ncbi:hypothetical protein RQP46_003211 [Phenoliferia psychrophenolica]
MARASFTTLPQELKAKVAEMVAAQEDAWDDRLNGQEGVDHLNSLSALALVNKELRGLAAKHQFGVLYSGEAFLPLYRYIILPRHGHHITVISFSNLAFGEGDPISAAALALSDAAHLPSVRSLYFDGMSASRLFGPSLKFNDPGKDEATSYRIDALAVFAPRIETLGLRAFAPSETVDLIRAFENLTTLSVTTLGNLDTDEQMMDFTNAISTLQKLKRLTISMDSEHPETAWTIEAIVPLERAAPPVKDLQLVRFNLDPTLFSLINAFSSTLESVTLRPSATAPEFSGITPLQLPHLVNLNLHLEESKTLSDISRLLLSSSTLTHMSLATTSNTDPADISAFLPSQPKLRQLHFGACLTEYPIPRIDVILRPSFLTAFADIVHSRGLDPTVLDSPHFTPFHENANLSYTKNEAGYLKEALGRTLEFGKVELERMFAEGSIARAVGWVAKLKALEDERLAWKD